MAFGVLLLGYRVAGDPDEIAGSLETREPIRASRGVKTFMRLLSS